MLIETREPLVASPLGPHDVRRALAVEAEAYVARSKVMLARARAVVLADRVDAIPLLGARRASLGDHFGRYQRFKHVGIFDPVVRDGTASSKIVARTMKVDCLKLGETFGAYHARWLGVQRSEWSSYRSDMLEMTQTLTGHLDAELRSIRQLLMIADQYRPRTAA